MLKRVICTTFFALTLVCFGARTKSDAALILAWNTFGNAGTETTETSVSNATGFQASSLNFTGSTVTPAGNSNRFGGNNWTVGGNFATAVTNNSYIQFTVSPTGGTSYSATTLDFIWDLSGNGPTAVGLRSSIDNFTANLGLLTGLTGSTSTVRSMAITGVTNVSNDVTFRFYGWNAVSAAGTAGFDTGTNASNVTFNGDITAVPEPSSIALVSLMGCTGLVAAYRRRKAKSKVA